LLEWAWWAWWAWLGPFGPSWPNNMGARPIWWLELEVPFDVHNK